MIVWRDGEFIDAAGAVSADDRGFLIGEAIFETLLADAGAPAFLDAHLGRMRRGLAAFHMAKRLDTDELRAAIREAMRRNAFTGRAVCRIALSRRGGARGLAPSPDAVERLMIAVSPAPPPPDFIRLAISTRRRPTFSSTNGFKCAGAYAENILARAEAAAQGAGEAIMLNEFGRVASASSANVFVIADGALKTPSLAEGAMPGVVRGVLIEEARRLGARVDETAIDPAALRSGTILLTNSVAGPVRSALDGSAPARGDDLPERLIDGYARRLAEEFGAGPRRD